MDYLSISKKERTGLIALIALISIIWLLPRFFTKPAADKTFLAKADSVLSVSRVTNVGVNKSFRLFAFDPNKLGDDGWRQLGLTEKNIKTIRNYLSKGGKFIDPKDIYRIYGLHSDLAEKLEPYIVIKGTVKASTFPQIPVRSFQPHVTTSAGREYKVPKIVNLNQADTSELIALPGIGSKLAQRIILFRDRCGGFHNIKQLAEVYGLKDSVFQLIAPRLVVEHVVLRRIPVNTISTDSLARHPYISYSQAKAIVQYRAQHGVYKNAEDLLNITILTNEWVEKLRPYLEFN